MLLGSEQGGWMKLGSDVLHAIREGRQVFPIQCFRNASCCASQLLSQSPHSPEPPHSLLACCASPSCASLHLLLCPAVSHPQPRVPPSQSCSSANPHPQIPVLVCCSIPAPPALSTMLMVLMMSDTSGRTKAGCARWRWWQKAVVRAGCQPVLEDTWLVVGEGAPAHLLQEMEVPAE